MDQLPIFFNLTDRWVAVLGGGGAAARKAELAMRAGAGVKVFAGDRKAGRARMFELFPYGYVKQACKIAGMKSARVEHRIGACRPQRGSERPGSASA
ncbi:MAG: TusE/DsrC/DsvC family sulfur relay protein [Xanthobacteraceae bacterium]|nr:TusE/DsrC/DsvC family sulfur relay protein [Xanthobacteraceae bacterium]